MTMNFHYGEMIWGLVVVPTGVQYTITDTPMYVHTYIGINEGSTAVEP